MFQTNSVRSDYYDFSAYLSLALWLTWIAQNPLYKPRKASSGSLGKCPDRTSTKASIERLLDKLKPLQISASKSFSVIMIGAHEYADVLAVNSAHSGSGEHNAVLVRNGSPKSNIPKSTWGNKGSSFEGAASAQAGVSANPSASLNAGGATVIGPWSTPRTKPPLFLQDFVSCLHLEFAAYAPTNFWPHLKRHSNVNVSIFTKTYRC